MGIMDQSTTNECDVLIAIGMRFDDRVEFVNLCQTKPNYFEIDPAEVNKC